MGPSDENDLLDYAFQTVPPRETPKLLIEGRGAKLEAENMVKRLTLAFFAVGSYHEARNPDHNIAERWTAKCEGDGGRWFVFVEVTKG